MRRTLCFVLFGVLGLFATAPAYAQEVPGPIFQMQDGSFYHPPSGKHAATRDDLLWLIANPTASVPPTAVPTAPVPVQAPEHLTLVSAIRRGREMMRAMPADPTPEAERPLIASQDEWREVTLAVWRKDTDEITSLTIQKKNAQVQLPATRPFDVKVVRSNGVNSLYEVSIPNAVVVAVRYPILKPVAKAGKTVGHRLSEYAVYTPYSAALHTPEMVEEGAVQLDGYVKKAFEFFRRTGVMSRAQKGKNIADVVDPNLAKTILVIEHLDASALVRDPKRAVETVLVTIAANPENVYGYSRSSAGALGIAQFMPKTYASMAKRPELGLVQDIDPGSTEPENATRAEIAYLDYILATMPADVRESYGSDTGKINEYLAAAYNGGSARVRYAIKIWDDQIAGILQPKQILLRARLRPETIGYVKKYRSAYDIFLAPSTTPTSSPVSAAFSH